MLSSGAPGPSCRFFVNAEYNESAEIDRFAVYAATHANISGSTMS
jgi:hypothetical protein